MFSNENGVWDKVVINIKCYLWGAKQSFYHKHMRLVKNQEKYIKVI